MCCSGLGFTFTLCTPRPWCEGIIRNRGRSIPGFLSIHIPLFPALSQSSSHLQPIKATKLPPLLQAGPNPAQLLPERVLQSCHEHFHLRRADLGNTRKTALKGKMEALMAAANSNSVTWLKLIQAFPELLGIMLGHQVL